MPPSRSRKRSNAFDDFPIELQAETASPETVSPLVRRAPQAEAPQVERIERLVPSQMIPDRFQPRRLLPPVIRNAFYDGMVDCYKAAREWLDMSKSDPGIKAEVDRLLQMGHSFDEHGQIKPITGTWVPATDGQFIFQIETGERRFWAACLKTVLDNIPDEPRLRVEVVAHPTRQRQVLENRHSEPPSAVEQACEVASLILAELNIQPDPAIGDEYDYFRAARAQRMPAGLWERIMPVMQLTRPRMVQLLNILQLPSHLLDLADRYRLPERVLREILALPQSNWERMLKHAIQNQLTSDEVADLGAQAVKDVHSGEKRAPQPIIEPSRQALRALRRFGLILSELDEVSRGQALDEIADTLVVTREADGIAALFEELGRSLEIRLMGK
ncbi:MAG: hypothetical protein ACYC6H_10220 [Bellilinea sp.]